MKNVSAEFKVELKRIFFLFLGIALFAIVYYAPALPDAVDPMGELLWKRGLYHGDRPGVGSGLRTISVEEIYQETKNVIENGNALSTLYEIYDKPLFKGE